jgi:DNA-binding transcriptional ArsR family regulator
MPGGISAARMDEAMRALADPTRREILRLVHEDELAAGEITRHFPAMSHARSRSARSRLGRVGAQRVAVCRAHADVSRRPPRPCGPFVR